MFEGLATEIDQLSIPPCGEAITEVLALRDRLDAKINDAVGAFDHAGLWDLDSATSMTAWLRQHGAMTRRAAARETGRAKKLRELPVTAAAWRAGELSGGQVEAMVAVIKPEMVSLFAEHETALVPSLVGLSVTDTSRAMGHWAAHAAALGDGPEPTEAKRGLHLSQMLDGTWVLDGTLDSESGEAVSPFAQPRAPTLTPSLLAPRASAGSMPWTTSAASTSITSTTARWGVTGRT